MKPALIRVLTTVLIPALLALAAPASAQHRADAPPDELIEKARRAALRYTAGLPDFICTQMVQRLEDPRGTNNWGRKDTLTVKLSYFNHLEDYKLIELDGKPTLLDFMNVQGPTTKGEFGTLLLLIFHPQSQAAFHWKGWSSIHKHRVAVYTYKIAKEHSSYMVAFGIPGGPNSILTAYHGEVFVDPESSQILHATQVADIPASFPITQSSTSIDYDYRDVGGQQHLLPVRADVFIESVSLPANARRTSRYRGRNLVEFKDFRKFQTETTITFNTVDEKPKTAPEKK